MSIPAWRGAHDDANLESWKRLRAPKAAPGASGPAIHLASRRHSFCQRGGAASVRDAFSHGLANGGRGVRQHRVRTGVPSGPACRPGGGRSGVHQRHRACRGRSMRHTVAALLLLATIVGAIGFGRAAMGSKTVADWAVGGRRLGTLLFWFMNAGEIYTTFAVFRIAGYAGAWGAPAYLAFCSVSLSFAIGYLLMPKIWRAGRSADLVTQADFFALRYDAPWLGVVTAAIGIASLLIYVQIQLVSLGLIVSLTFGQTLSPTLSLVAAGAAMVAFVLVAGLRSAAFAAAVKDVMMIVLVLLLASTVAHKVGASSMLDIFGMAEAIRPGIGKLPGADPGAPTTTVWLITAALNVALGNWVFPHLFQISYAAHSATAIRRNAIWQPIYSLAYFFIIVLGLAALVAGTMPAGNDMNAALLQFVSTRYPDWVVGLLAGTGVLLALVPGAVLLLTAGTIFTRNMVRPVCPALSEARALAVSRAALVAVAALAGWVGRKVFGGKGGRVGLGGVGGGGRLGGLARSAGGVRCAGRVAGAGAPGLSGGDFAQSLFRHRHVGPRGVPGLFVGENEGVGGGRRHRRGLCRIARPVCATVLGRLVSGVGGGPDRDGAQCRHRALRQRGNAAACGGRRCAGPALAHAPIDPTPDLVSRKQGP